MRTLEVAGVAHAGAPRRSAAYATAAGVVLVTAFGAALRFAGLDAQSFWYDEAFSASLAATPTLDVLSGRVRDLGNPPLYPVLLRLWSFAFGSSDVALRAFSATASVASIPLAFAVVRRLAGARVALLSAGLLSVSPYHVYLGQEARAFALVTLLGLASIQLLLVALERPRRLLPWFGYAAATFGALYAHYVAVFLVPAGLLLVLMRGRPAIPGLLRWSAALSLAALPYLTWLPALLAQLGTEGNAGRAVDTWWMHAATTPAVFTVGTTLVWKGEDLWTGGLVLAGVAAVAAAIPLALALLSARRPGGARALLAWLLPPLLLAVLVSAAVVPIYSTRYVAYVAPAFYALLALGLLRLGPALRMACLAGLLFPMAVSLARYASGPVKHDWRGAAEHVAARAAPGEPIVFEAGFNEEAFARYATGPNDRLRVIHPRPGDPPGTPLTFARFRAGPEAPLAPALERAGAFWLVESDAPPGWRQRHAPLLEGRIATGEASFRGIRITRYERAASAAADAR